MATAAVLGVQQVRSSFLDDLCFRTRCQTCNAFARDTRRDHARTNGAETRCRRCIGRSRCNRRGESISFRPEPLTRMRAQPVFRLHPPVDDDDPDDEDLDDEDDEVEEDEEDDGDEEVWQVRLT